MKTQKPFISIFVFLAAVTLINEKALALSSQEDEPEVGYETIISELSKGQSRAERPDYSADIFDSIKIHSGVGFVHSLVRIRTENGETEGSQRGVQASLGIDLFSKHWFAEGAIRSFGEGQLDSGKIQLREFDLKTVYRTNPYNLFGIHFGMGLAARNLKLINSGGVTNISTPATIALVGFDANVTENISVGGEASYRAAMIKESADRSSIDIALKLDAHF